MVGQALVAASRTVEGIAAHSLHAYFILGGDPKVPIIYEVERTRDGKSFTTRSVKAIQHGQPIFTMMVSFHNNEEGLDNQLPMPEVPMPDELPTEAEARRDILPTLPEQVRRYYERPLPIDLRPVEYSHYLGKKPSTDRFNVWFKTTAAAAGRSGDPSLRARLCIGSDTARFCSGAARAHAVRARLHGREPRSCAVAAPAVSRRRMDALFAGLRPICTARAGFRAD